MQMEEGKQKQKSPNILMGALIFFTYTTQGSKALKNIRDS